MSPFAAFAPGPSSAVWIKQGLPLVHALPLPAGEAYQVVAAAAGPAAAASAASPAQRVSGKARPRTSSVSRNPAARNFPARPMRTVPRSRFRQASERTCGGVELAARVASDGCPRLDSRAGARDR